MARGNDRADNRHEDQGRNERCGHNDNHDRGKIGHEFADDTGPEQQGHKCGKRRCRCTDHRYEHLVHRLNEGFLLGDTFLQLSLCIFDDHHGVVDQDAHSNNQPEHDHHVDGHPGHLHVEKCDHERQRDRHADHERRTHTQDRDTGYQHQRDGRQDRSFERPEQAERRFCLIEKEAVPNALRPVGGSLLGQRPNAVRDFDNVGARFLAHPKDQGRGSVDIGVFGCVFERARDVCYIAECDDIVPIRFDGKLKDILRTGDQAGHFNAERTLTRVDRAAGDNEVVAGQCIEQLVGREVVGLQAHQIDCHLDHFVARARQGDFAHRANTL